MQAEASTSGSRASSRSRSHPRRQTRLVFVEPARRRLRPRSYGSNRVGNCPRGAATSAPAGRSSHERDRPTRARSPASPSAMLAECGGDTERRWRLQPRAREADAGTALCAGRKNLALRSPTRPRGGDVGAKTLIAGPPRLILELSGMAMAARRSSSGERGHGVEKSRTVYGVEGKHIALAKTRKRRSGRGNGGERSALCASELDRAVAEQAARAWRRGRARTAPIDADQDPYGHKSTAYGVPLRCRIPTAPPAWSDRGRPRRQRPCCSERFVGRGPQVLERITTARREPNDSATVLPPRWCTALSK